MAVDPVRARRARIAGWVRSGKRLGYGLFLLASLLFAAGLVGGFTEALTTAIIGGLLVGSGLLAPAIVFGYAVNAAERDDVAQGR